MSRFKSHVILGLVACVAISTPAMASPIISALDPALTGATVQDFESATAGNFVSQTYGGLTVTAVNSAAVPAASFDIAGDYNGGFNNQGLQHISNLGSEFQALRFDFSGATSAFGFLFGASDSSWTLSAFDAGNVLLDTTNIPPVFASNAGDFFGLGGLSGASYATLTQNFDGIYAAGGVDYVFVDNFTYVSGRIVTPVPEPLTISLFAAGLAGAATMRRRRKN